MAKAREEEEEREAQSAVRDRPPRERPPRPAADFDSPEATFGDEPAVVERE
jgi:hypothetical protein